MSSTSYGEFAITSSSPRENLTGLIDLNRILDMLDHENLIAFKRRHQIFMRKSSAYIARKKLGTITIVKQKDKGGDITKIY